VPLTIPEEHHAAIGKIIKLTDASVRELISAISAVKIKSSASEMTELIRPQVTSIPPGDLAEIVDTIYALYHVREFSEVSRDTFLSDIVTTIKDLAPEIGSKALELAKLRRRFRQLLDISTLNALAKAIELQRDGERIFCSARIVSDIRPVFGDNVKERPGSAVIRHTLGLSYHQDGDHREFFAILDEADLVALSDVIIRAMEKGETLAKFLKQSGISRLGI